MDCPVKPGNDKGNQAGQWQGKSSRAMTAKVKPGNDHA